METSFFSGSENLYKYLVTVGILLSVLTVYYPLREKQDLEISCIQTEKEAKVLKFKIDQNDKEVSLLNKLKDGVTSTHAEHLRKIQNENTIKQIELENKVEELEARAFYIKIYKFLFWVFFPIGIALMIFGFKKWHDSKKVDDEIKKLEKTKLEKEVNNMP